MSKKFISTIVLIPFLLPLALPALAYRSSGRDTAPPPTQAKERGGWEVCVRDAYGEKCYGDLPRAEAEEIAEKRMNDPDRTPGVIVWAQEIRG